MNEAEARAAIAGLLDADGTPIVRPEEVTQVLTEDGWLAVVLGERREPRERLGRLHAHLSRAFPNVEVEIRSAASVYRGGAGLGERRHCRCRPGRQRWRRQVHRRG